MRLARGAIVDTRVPQVSGNALARQSSMDAEGRSDSLARLRIDVASARILVWVASVGREAELTEEAHRYFFDRYRRLGHCYRRRGNEARAREMEAKADEHSQPGSWDGPPYAAAMGMPRPRRWLTTDAVSRYRLGGPKDAA